MSLAARWRDELLKAAKLLMEVKKNLDFSVLQSNK
jgi:hypothetical protein